MNFSHIQPNANYGSGYFLRALQITTPSRGTILLGMEDTYHAFQISFTYDKKQVTSIDARWHRHPMSACSGAGGASGTINDMVGCPVSGDMRALQARLDHSPQCTHMFDMFRLGVLHAHHAREDRRYDVTIQDTLQPPQVAELRVNGQLMLSLSVENDIILAPEKFRGANMFHGFAAWATTHLMDWEFEQAFILQRALFVSPGRRLNLEATIGKPSIWSGPPVGSCYASQPGRYEDSVRLGNAKDLYW